MIKKTNQQVNLYRNEKTISKKDTNKMLNSRGTSR